MIHRAILSRLDEPKWMDDDLLVTAMAEFDGATVRTYGLLGTAVIPAPASLTIVFFWWLGHARRPRRKTG